jgi:hypothetical protein
MITTSRRNEAHIPRSISSSGTMSNGCAAIREDREPLEDEEVETVFVASRVGAYQRDEDKVPNATEETGALGVNHIADLPTLGIALVMRASITGTSLIQLFSCSWLLRGVCAEA